METFQYDCEKRFVVLFRTVPGAPTDVGGAGYEIKPPSILRFWLSKQNKNIPKQAVRQPPKITNKTKTAELTEGRLRALERAAKTEREIERRIAKSENASGVTRLKTGEVSKRYAQCLVEPCKYATRVPEAAPVASSLVKTRRVFNVPMTLNEAQNSYIFAGCFRPKFGRTGQQHTYQAAFVDFTNGDNPNLAIHSNWRHVIGGTDVALDPNMGILVNQAAFSAIYGITRPIMPPDPAPPLADVVLLRQNGHNMSTNSNSVEIRNNALNSRSAVYVPAGNWTFTIQTLLEVDVLVTDPIVVNIVSPTGSRSISAFPESPDAPNPGAPRQYYASYSVTIKPDEYITFTSNETAETKFQNVNFTINSASFPGINDSPDYGIVEAVRPVAMSVLATCTTSQIAAGGMTAIMLSPENFDDKIYSEKAIWKTVAGLTSYREENSAANPFLQGSYCWWKPVTSSVTQWTTPSESLNIETPAILLAGNCPAILGGGIPSMTITLECVFEISHGSQLLERDRNASDSVTRERALNAVAGVVCATENPGHHGLIKDVGSLLGGWAGSLLADIF